MRPQYPGGIDEFVRTQLGYPDNETLYAHLFGYQIDGFALQLDSMLNGRAFIIGDDTEVGKGRQAAAQIAWAVKNGKIPIFTTAQDNRYNDMYRDLADIGFDHPEWALVAPGRTS